LGGIALVAGVDLMVKKDTDVVEMTSAIMDLVLSAASGEVVRAPRISPAPRAYISPRLVAGAGGDARGKY
jgi:hypothetical protein